ncbi:Aspartic peptidase domain containing protein [Naviculisporaceae sp. PSN 640]
MRSLALSAVALPLLAWSPALALSTSTKSLVTRGNGYLRHPIRTVAGAPKHRRRQTEEETTTPHHNGASYTIDIEIGTPPQTITVILDTGSNDLWVNPTCVTANIPDYCNQFAQFDWTASSTLQDLEVAHIIRYGKGNVTFQWVADAVTIGGGTIPTQIFGIGLESYDIPMGILGLSPSIAGPNAGDNYGFLLDSLVTERLIASRAFSLDLREIESPEGAIIFGGIDTGKFIGNLERLPMLDPQDTPVGADRYFIYLNGVGVSLPDGSALASDAFQLPIFLDSGGTYSRLPSKIFVAIGEAVPGSQYDPASNLFFADCALANEPGSIDFFFNNKVISVPWKDFLWDSGDGGPCSVGVMEMEEGGEPVFGDTFLRAAYVVYDQDNRELHLAQAANCGTNIVPIGSGPDAVPSGLTGDCEGSTGATATAALDVTATHAPTNIITNAPTVTNAPGFGPGPAQTGLTTTLGGLTRPTGGPQPFGNKNGAVSASVGMGALVALGVVNLIALAL